MAKDKGKGLAILITNKASKKAKDMYPGNSPAKESDAMGEELDMAAGDVMAAVNAGDTKALSSALRSFMDLNY